MTEDVFGPGGHTARPSHPDFWRISEICLMLRAEINEAQTDEERERVWRRRVQEVGDFDSIQYHAVQTGIQILGLDTYEKYTENWENPIGRMRFVQIVQAFYDGLIVGSLFEKRGGKQDG